MPAWASFDPGLISSSTNNGLYSALLGISCVDLKKGTSSYYSSYIQPQLQLLTPPPSPVALSSSPFDEVPYEILDEIFGMIQADTSRDIYDVLRDISACCLVSKKFHTVGINWLYRHVPISDPYAFTKVISSFTFLFATDLTKFYTQISQHPEKGLLVKTLDFSPFSVMSLGRSANDNKQIKMVCSETLMECLTLTPNLQEVKAFATLLTFSCL
jgi:hypothetical protein